MSIALKPVHQRLHLYTEGNDTYLFTPEGNDAQALTIHRASGDITLNRLKVPLPPYALRSSKVIYGIIGLISLSLSEYIIVITGRESLGRLMGHEVYRATNFDILPLNPHVSSHNPPHPVESHLLALVRSHLHGGNFLFSYTWDLTRRLQAQWQSREKDVGKPLWQVADDRFFWNKFLQSRLIDLTTSDAKQDLSQYILPVMYGTFDLRPAFLHGRHMQLCLISRRSRFRAGTRYFRRGIDHDGHVANFNETEQLVLIEGQTTPGAPRPEDDSFATKLSFVQIRGSVPLFWSEINTLRYKPDLQIMDLQDTTNAMQKHLTEQVELYGEQALVNLVNQKGHEQPVKEAYERYVAQINVPKTRYEYFDFHNECRKMRWDRISVLIDRMQEDIDRHGYFQLNADNPTPVKMQKGVIRTNCMDNLDRTNVVQAALAKWTLNVQLRELGILSETAGIDDYEAFSKDFREMWADHADAIAKAYGGSGALKSDFTRTNLRTRKGLLEDGVKSVTRYLKNTFFDGARQDGFDLMTGTWRPRKSPSSALFLITDGRPLITRSMPVIASFSLFMICAGLTLPRTSDYSLFYYFMLWFTLMSIALIFMLIHGIDYVAWPRLIPPTDVIYYNGPGFRSARNGMGLNPKVAGELGKQHNLWLGSGRVRTATEEVEMGTIKKRVD
ncbi:inositol/phosphatidylinositol phosphatase [Crucibulum laeve]|uniref:Inositol/phosphatidylinositol phosphatase n=1 Tax=Crucibulum laeve TaxID=68775 RepID=A0A5C3M7J7_9AGAR|nr:inositol/phosphatidylinositol phosphatase [Crucibulum laeve]